MDIFSVSFFGHRYVDDYNKVENKLYEIIAEILRQHEYTDLFVGNNGDFDRIVSSVIRKIQKNVSHENNSHILVLPYETAKYRNNKEYYLNYYDEIEICDGSVCTYPKKSIIIRNRCIIDKSDLCIFYVNKNYGGAYMAFDYAIKQKTKYINIFDLFSES